jgi:N-methylhydantoinase A
VLVNARVAVVGVLPDLPQEPRVTVRPPAEPRSYRRVYLGKWCEAPVFAIDDLMPDQTITGAAVIESATTTVLLRSGDHAKTTAFGWLDIRIETAA